MSITHVQMGDNPDIILTNAVENIEVSLMVSLYDGVPLIQIDTQIKTGRFRVIVNDGEIWDADSNDHHHTPCECTARWRRGE